MRTMYFQKAYMECLLQQRTGWNAEEDSLIQEQLRMLAEAILAGETSFSKEKGEELLVQNGIGRTQPPKWTAEQKEEIRKTLKEVQIWPKLAEEWLEKIIDYKGEAR